MRPPVNTAKAYLWLPPELKASLEEEAFVLGVPLSEHIRTVLQSRRTALECPDTIMTADGSVVWWGTGDKGQKMIVSDAGDSQGRAVWEFDGKSWGTLSPATRKKK